MSSKSLNTSYQDLYKDYSTSVWKNGNNIENNGYKNTITAHLINNKLINIFFMNYFVIKFRLISRLKYLQIMSHINSTSKELTKTLRYDNNYEHSKTSRSLDLFSFYN